MPVAIESISPSAGDATDRFLVRRGAGPLGHTIELLSSTSVKALLAIAPGDVTGLSEAIDDRVAALLVAGSNVTLTYDDVLNTLTVAVTGGGGSVLSGDATLTLPVNQYEHEETVAAVGVTGSNRISVWLDPATDDDENVPEMTDLITLAAAPGTDQITVTAAFSIPHHGPLKIQWSAF